MEVDSETPPTSPYLEFSEGDGRGTAADTGVVYCFNCKGIPEPHDHLFSPEGYILRREVISAIDNFDLASVTNVSNGNGTGKGGLIRCFGFGTDLLEQQRVKEMVMICRKNVASLEILAENTNAVAVPLTSNGSKQDPDDLYNLKPWNLRRNVCHFLNRIVHELKYYRQAWKTELLEAVFSGLKKSLGSVHDWSSILRSHSGFHGGNQECSSAVYHFFHIQLELRWSLFLIFGASPEVIHWILSDLIELALYKYTSEKDTPLDVKQPFNCACVKELWTMIRLVVDDRMPEQGAFWKLFVEALKRNKCPDVFFPIWLTSYLSPISEYVNSGVFCPGQSQSLRQSMGSSLYKIAVQDAFKNWMNSGGKSVEILKLTFNFFEHWGPDFDVLLCLWTQWVPRLDKGSEVLNFESYSRMNNWLALLDQICSCERSDEERNNYEGDREPLKGRSHKIKPSNQHYLGSNSDPFVDFVRLAASYMNICTEKDFKRLFANICFKLTSKTDPNNFGELGILRVCTLFLTLILKLNNFKGTAVMETAGRLQGIFNYSRGKLSPGRRKTILRAHSVMIILFLHKKIEISLQNSVVKKYMEIIDELLSNSQTTTGSIDPVTRKDLVMIYIDFLGMISSRTPRLSTETNLGRHHLISTNLLLWLCNCDANYTVRTIHVLNDLIDWIPCGFSSQSSLEANNLFLKISEKSMPYIESCVISSANRIPSTDMKPIATLAARVTVLNLKFKGSSAQEQVDFWFERFAMNERTCPVVSQHYIKAIVADKEFFEHTNKQLFAGTIKSWNVKWAQAWLRLVMLDCIVPDDLTESILQGSFSSTSNADLLGAFCKKQDAWGKENVQKITGSAVKLLKSIVDGSLLKGQGTGEAARGADCLTNSVITSCVTLLSCIHFDWIYIKGCSTSCGHEFLNFLIPQSWPGTPPWEKLSSSVLSALECNMYQLFDAIIKYSGLSHDQYLKRKLQDLVVLVLFGFVRGSDEVNKVHHPLFTILNRCEEANITIIHNEILPNILAGNSLTEARLSQRFIGAVAMVRAKGFATLVARLLSGVIRVFINLPKDSNRSQHGILITYCCMIGVTPHYRDLVLKAFTDVFIREFRFRSQQVFGLCMHIAKGSSTNIGRARMFLKKELIPLLKPLVQETEVRRGIGNDQSLRVPLQRLVDEVADIEL